MKKKKHDIKSIANEEELKNKVSEPEAFYKKTLQTFNSFEESNEADAKQMAAIPPTEHLKNVTALIKQVYKEELKEPMDKKLNFE